MGRIHTEYYDRHKTATRQRRMHHELCFWFSYLYIKKAGPHTCGHSLHLHPTKSTSPQPQPQPTAMWNNEIDWDKEIEESALLLNSTRILVYRHLLLNQHEKKQEPKKRKAKPRRWYVRPWIEEREKYGHYHQLLPELQAKDPDTFRYYLRVDHGLFQQILERIKPHITRQDTNWKKALEPGLRLAITLRFMATGEAYKSMALNFRTAGNSISTLVPDTCEAIITEFMKDVIVCPSTPQDWKDVAEGFGSTWHFYNALGAIDGKHVAIQAPLNSGSYYFNYKGYHSIVLLALVDARGKFMYVDVGANGSCSDAGIFQVTHLRHALENNTAGLPPPAPLPGDDRPVPFFILGDAAFPMREWLQKPYPQKGLRQNERNYNYRLSRARRVVENAFGMWANRFRVFLTTINLKPETVQKLVLASCIIHNLLRDFNPDNYRLPEHAPETPEGDWIRDPLDGLEPRPRQSGSVRAKSVRTYLTKYYNRHGNRLPWQRN